MCRECSVPPVPVGKGGRWAKVVTWARAMAGLDKGSVEEQPPMEAEGREGAAGLSGSKPCVR